MVLCFHCHLLCVLCRPVLSLHPFEIDSYEVIFIRGYLLYFMLSGISLLLQKVYSQLCWDHCSWVLPGWAQGESTSGPCSLSHFGLEKAIKGQTTRDSCGGSRKDSLFPLGTMGQTGVDWRTALSLLGGRTCLPRKKTAGRASNSCPRGT